LSEKYPVGIAYQESHPGHSGLAGTVGGSDPGLGSIGGASGGPPATEKQISYVKSLVSGTSDERLLNPDGAKSELNKAFRYPGKEFRHPDGIFDLDMPTGTMAGSVLASRFIKWRNSTDFSKMTKSQASMFLDAATHGTGTAFRGFVRLKTGSDQQDINRYYQGLINETQKYVKMGWDAAGTAIPKDYGIDHKIDF